MQKGGTDFYEAAFHTRILRASDRANPFFDSQFNWTLSAVSEGTARKSRSDYEIELGVKLLGALTKSEVRLRLAQEKQSELCLEAANERSR